MEPEKGDSLQQSWIDELKRGNDLTAELIRVHKSWRLALRQGLLAGLGGAIGASLLVSLLLWMLKPLNRLETFKPALDQIAQELQRRPLK